ncbi:hypothetical protein D3C72_1964610 [compost metagenome]
MRLIGLNLPFQLIHQSLLLLHLLFGNRVLLKQQLIACQFSFRIAQLRHILLLRALRLGQFHLKRRRIYLRQQLAFGNQMAFLKINALQCT